MMKRSFMALLACGLVFASCSKETEQLMSHANVQKSETGPFVLTDSIINAHSVLKEGIKNSKPLPNTFKFEYPEYVVMTYARLGHGGCSQSKGMCMMDTLYSPVPSVDAVGGFYNINYVLPTADTLYPGVVYLLSDTNAIYFPSQHMHLTDKTVPITEDVIIPANVASALGTPTLRFKPGLYQLHTNLATTATGNNGYIIVDCAP